MATVRPAPGPRAAGRGRRRVPRDQRGPILNRELSWIEFNARVLHEARDTRNPLLERVKFLAIFASNLDEFFQVRVSGLRRQVQAERRAPLARRPDAGAAARRDPRARPGARRRPRGDLDGDPQGARGRGRRDPRLRRGPRAPRDAPPALPRRDLPGPHAARRGSRATRSRTSARCRSRSRSACATRRRARSASPGSRSRRSCPACSRSSATSSSCSTRSSRPTSTSCSAGMEILETHLFRVTRDADITIEEDEADDLLLAIEEEVRRRRFGEAVRLEVERSHARGHPPDPDQGHRRPRGGLRSRSRACSTSPPSGSSSASTGPTSRRPPHTPVIPQRLLPPDEDEPADVFAQMRAGDIFLHHPYESFTASVERFIDQAADDPEVLTIKQTLYRTSGDSPIVRALIRAAERGKQVVVLVEIKARFDEENNIVWARRLEQAGAHVVYGLVGLKTHSKVALVVRREGSGPAPVRPHRHRQLQRQDRPPVRRPRAPHLPRGARRGRRPTCSTSSPASRASGSSGACSSRR